MHTSLHMYAYMHMHAHTCLLLYACENTCTYICMQAHTHTHTHTRARIHTRTHACMHTHTHTHSRTHACTHARMHTRTHTHTHTHTGTHTCTHTHTFHINSWSSTLLYIILEIIVYMHDIQYICTCNNNFPVYCYSWYSMMAWVGAAFPIVVLSSCCEAVHDKLRMSSVVYVISTFMSSKVIRDSSLQGGRKWCSVHVCGGGGELCNISIIVIIVIDIYHENHCLWFWYHV